MKATSSFLLGLIVLCAVGCGEKEATIPEAWTKTPEAEKAQRITKMPLSQDQKIKGINELKLSDADKQKYIDEVKSGGGPTAPVGGVQKTPMATTGG